MSDHCKCCCSNNQWVEEHIDPGATLHDPTITPEVAVAMAQECFGPLTSAEVETIREYITTLQEG